MDTVKKNYLRDLARRVKDLSESEHNRNIIKKYYDVNSLKEVSSPPITVKLPVQAVSEYMSGEELRIEDKLFSELEYKLKWKLCRAKKLGDDMPVTGMYYTGSFHTITPLMEGYKNVKFDAEYNTCSFEPCLNEYSDLKKMRVPELIVDHKKTDSVYEQINDVLGDILTVVKGAPFSHTNGWGDSMIDLYYEMRGPLQTNYDLIDAPEFVHEAMDIMTNAKIRLLEQYKAEGILVLNNGESQIGSSSLGFCRELPGMDFDPARINEKNLWGFAQAQEFSGISKEMLEEFVLPYQAKIINRFGLSLYGCCEAMEQKIGSVEKYIKNLRMISISPFTKHEIAAPLCKGKYVYAWKPQPSYITCFNGKMIEEEAKTVFEAVRGCCVTVTLMDVYNFEGSVNCFNTWLEIMRKASAECF